ncbi:MAG: Hsp20/alpha crystallin family protein [Terriglobia bacterium]
MFRSSPSFVELIRLQEDVSQLISHLSERISEGLLSSNSQWAPNIDLSEDAEKIVVKAEVPGVHAKDLEILIREGFLRISGEKKQPIHRNQVRYICLERSYGKFSRNLYLSAAIDIKGVRARLQDGLVTIWLPKLPNRRQLERIIPIES